MSPRVGCWAVCAALLLSSLARGDEEADYRTAATKLARTLALVAADQGPKAAERLAGPALPAALRPPLRQVAKSPRAADLRGLEPAMKGDLLVALLNESPKLDQALTIYARDAGRRLARELARLRTRSEALRAAAASLLAAARRDQVATRKVARGRVEGATLLLYAAQWPLLLALLEEAKSPPARYRVLTRLFDRKPDALALGLLTLGPRLLKQAPADVGAVRGAPALRKARDAAQAHLGGTIARLTKAIAAAVDAVQRIRTTELKRITQNARGKEYEEIVPQVKVYRRQFKKTPTLQPTRYADVHKDTGSARLHFWLEDEQRWVRGHRRVDPLEPVVARLLAAEDPELRRLATRPRALARVYGLFEAYAQQPFSAGYQTFREQVREIATKLEALAAQARAHGLGGEDLAAALAARAGVALSLFRGGPARAESRLSDQLLRATVDRGLEAGWLLTQDVERLSREVRVLQLRGFGLETDAGQRTRGLWWEPAPRAATWLVPPPEQLKPGQTRCWVWFLTRPGDAATAPRVTVYARSGGRDLTAVTRLAAGRASELKLSAGPPRLVARRVLGRGHRLWILPRGRAPLLLTAKGPGGERSLAPAPDGGWLRPGAADTAGTWSVRAHTATGETLATLDLEVPAVRGVVLGSASRRAWWVAPKGALEARVVEGGRPARGPQRFWIKDAWGRLIHQASGDRLSWKASVPPGRYRIGAIGAQETPLPVCAKPPRLVTVRSPAGRPVTAVHPGEALFLRLDAWPVVLAEETLAVRWRIRGSAGQLARRTTRPLPGHVGAAHLLPLRLRAGSRPGKREVEADVVTARGTLTIKGSFRVTAGGRRVAVTLRGPEGPTQRIELGTPAGLLRAQGDLSEARWTLVGPTGLVRPLLPRYDAQVPLTLDERQPAGPYWVFLSGATRAGERVFGELRLVGDRPARLTLAPPQDRTIGRTIQLRVRAPRGFEAPYQVRLGKGEWVKGLALRVTISANNTLSITLQDRRGRRARGTLRFRGELGKVAVGGPRFGIAANVTTRRIFAADYALLQSYQQDDQKLLPKDWVVLELGPLTVDGVRDRIFRTVPYDGPGKGGRNVAYRSERFWGRLQTSARERFDDLGIAPNTPYEVLNTASPRGERTLFDLVARHLARAGGWTFRLRSVRVRADGSTPREGASVIRMIRSGINKRGGSARRIEVPGPLADLALAVSLPETLDLARSHRLSFSLSAQRNKLLEGRYPDDWEQLAKHAWVCPELTVKLEVAGETLSATGRSAAKLLRGIELGLAFDHLKTEPTRFAGKPRGAERHRLSLGALGDKPSTLERAFRPLQPGVLANEPQTLTITVVGRQRRAVPDARWPKARSAPKVEVDGQTFRFETQDVPESSIELKIVYVRRAAEARTAAPRPKPALPPLRAGSKPRPIDLSKRLAEAARALSRDRFDAGERAAQLALLEAPADPRPWALLAEVAHDRQRPQVALARAQWSRDLRPTPRAWLVTAEVLLGQGDLDGATKALKQGLKLKPTGRLAARYRELKKVLD